MHHRNGGHAGERTRGLPPLQLRPADGHKGTFGRVLIVAGSRGMSGAACLAGLGALRGGAGLVTLAVPCGIVQTVGSVEPSYLTHPLPEDADGRIDGRLARELIIEKLHSIDAAAIGPGLGQSDALRELVIDLYRTMDLPMVFDADALNLLAPLESVPPRTVSATRILTPHPGEYSRLSGLSIEEVSVDREESAAEFARKHQVVLLLKGQGTVVTDGHSRGVNQTGNCGMATGGTGDVLTGLTAALLGQDYPGWDAARLGAHLHGLAGGLGAGQPSQPGLIASDLPRFLGAAWKEFTHSLEPLD